MDYFLLDDKESYNLSGTDYHGIDLNDEKMIGHEPFYICGYQNHIENNEREFSRIFPKNHTFTNVLDPRECTVGICHMDLRNEPFCDKIREKPEPKDANNDFETVPFNPNSPQVQLTSGKLERDTFIKSTDVENRLKKTDFKDTKCFVKDYKKNSNINNELAKKDYLIPVRPKGAVECGTFREFSTLRDEFEVDPDDRFFYNNTKRKTLSNW